MNNILRRVAFVILIFLVVGVAVKFIGGKPGSSDISDFENIPMYPKIELQSKKYLPPCPGEMGVCDVYMYTYRSEASYDTILDWYEKDLGNTGWILTGGAGDGNSSRYGWYHPQEDPDTSAHLNINFIKKGIMQHDGTINTSEDFTEIIYKLSKEIYSKFHTAESKANLKSISTANWKTFIKKDTFRFPYPDTISETSSGEAGPATITVSLPQIDSPDISEKSLLLMYYPSTSSAEDEVDTRVKQNTSFASVVKNDYSVGGVKGKQIIYSDKNLNKMQLFVLNKGMMYQFQILWKTENEAITTQYVNHIVSGFTFLD